jgi:hypothetical protein
VTHDCNDAYFLLVIDLRSMSTSGRLLGFRSITSEINAWLRSQGLLAPVVKQELGGI